MLSVARRCPSCQYRTLDAFAALAGLSIHRPIALNLRRILPATKEPHLFSTRHLSSNRDTPDGLSSDHAGEFSIRRRELSTEAEQKIPWYLQAHSQRDAEPILKRQELPDLPRDAPEKLKPILERLSMEIGLDDLRLIDLRSLDPPPALGSNLLMVIGTTRSEKHLHVSADRFCRWLRTEYKLRPYADGLLGRNELKLKLRRKARRVKLLGGTARRSEEDDGIRSNWICVHVGPIEDARGVEQSLQEQGIIGFGGSEDGTQLVVQMMTEDKRETLDLETLWNGRMDRQIRKSLSESPHFETAEVANTDDHSNPSTHDVNSFVGHITSTVHTRISAVSQQTRGYHVSSTLQGPIASQSKFKFVRKQSSPDHTETQSGLEATMDGYQFMTTHLSRLTNMDTKGIIGALGQNAGDKTSTEFLSSIYRRFPRFPDQRYYGLRLFMIQHAINAGHKSYSTADLVGIVKEASESGETLTEDLYVLVVRSIADSVKQEAYDSRDRDVTDPIYRMVEVVEEMELRNINWRSPAIVNCLWVAFQHAYPLQDVHHAPVAGFLSVAYMAALMRDFGDGPLPLSLCTRTLSYHASIGDWNQFWEFWSLLPANLLRRPQVLYTELFNQLAKSGHQRRCADALTEWIPYLSLEQPKVEITADLSRAIIECMRVADPALELQRESRSNKTGQWIRLYRVCTDGLQKAPEDTEKKQAEAKMRFGGLAMYELGEGEADAEGGLKVPHD